MSYESPLKYFRDQYKNPDEYKIKHPDWRDPELPDKSETELENSPITEKPESKKEKIGETGLKYQMAIELVKNAALKPEFASDQEEQAILEKRKQVILQYLDNVLDDVQNYLSQVNYLQLQKMDSYDDVAKYQETIKNSDGQRRIYHNKLISDLEIVIRQININFSADFPEDLRLKQESVMEDRQGMSRLFVQRPWQIR